MSDFHPQDEASVSHHRHQETSDLQDEAVDILISGRTNRCSII